MTRLHLKVGGMHCSFCSQSIERAYARTDGVEKVSVSLAHEEGLDELPLPDAFEVSRNSCRKTKQNLALANSFGGRLAGGRA